MTALHFSGYGNICQGKKGKKKSFICFTVVPKTSSWIRASLVTCCKNVNANKVSALKSLQISTGSNKGYQPLVPKQKALFSHCSQLPPNLAVIRWLISPRHCRQSVYCEDKSDREVNVPPGQPIPCTICRAEGLWTPCRHEFQNAFSLLPSQPAQDCSFGQWAYIKCWFHCPDSVSSPASTPGCLAPYEAYVRKKTQCHSQELSVNEFIFFLIRKKIARMGRNKNNHSCLQQLSRTATTRRMRDI